MSSASGDSKFSATSSSMSYLKTSTFKSFGELSDVVSVVFFCAADSTMMLVVEPNSNEYWIPSVKVPGGTSWVARLVKELVQDIFGTTFQPDRLLRFNKVWLPTAAKHNYICHTIFNAQVKMDIKKKSKSLFGKFKGKINWINYDDLVKFHNINFLKSPELVDFICWNLNKSSHIVNIPSEHMTVFNFMEIPEGVLVTGKNTIYEQIIDASGIDIQVQEALYKEFLLMCFPSMYLTLPTFTKFIAELGWAKEEIPHLFRSADMYSRGGLSFREFLYFIAATEPGTTHGGGAAELRCRYIFRYLDTDRNNLLKRDEMRNFIVTLRKSRKQPVDQLNVEKDLTECYLNIGFPESHGITMTEFLHAVGELKVRGTSQIYRAPVSIQKYIKEISERDSRAKGGQVGKVGAHPVGKRQGYELAVHSVKIQKSGTAINIEQFWNIEHAVSITSMHNFYINDPTRKASTNKFDQTSKSNELLKALRYLVQINKNLHSPYMKLESFGFNWGQLDPNVVAQYLNAVCTELQDIFKKEPRLLQVPAPVYILGDLHGNIADLLYFERIFWHVGPGLCPCNILFLGDYVDRGLYSFEVICYLFTYKLQSPRKVFLLRGNHEIRRVQLQWTFEKECKRKFGDKLGLYVFSMINDVFDTLPLAAVVDGTVFCCHGGIPPPWLCPVATAINDIPAPLVDPLDQSALAWELMWNDPLRSRFLTEKVAMELVANEGFATNNRRGTAHIFSVEALEKFLSANGYTHLVRAHEVVEAGFYLQQKGHLVTVFSSSKYCGGDNMAACILADQGKLRTLRIEMEQ